MLDTHGWKTTPTTLNTSTEAKVTSIYPFLSQATIYPAVVLTTSDKCYVSLTIIAGMLSMFGSLLITFTFIVYKDIQTTSRRLLVYLSISDFVTALGNCIGVIGYLESARFLDKSEGKSSALCIFPTYLTLVSSMSSFWWTACIAVYLYLCIVKGDHCLAEKLIIVYHLCCWTVPITIASVALGMDVLGYDFKVNTVSWCWIKGNMTSQDQLGWQFLTGPAWQITAIVISGVLYARIKYYIRKEMRNENLHYVSQDTLMVISQANKKLTFVPVVFVLLRIWGTVRFLVDIHTQGKSVISVPLELLQAIGDSSQGFANSVLFCFCTPKIRHRLMTSCKNASNSVRNLFSRTQMSRGILGRTAAAPISYNHVCGDKLVAKKHCNERTPLNRGNQ